MKCNRHMSSQISCGEHFKGRLRSLSCISLLMYRVTLLTLFAGCEKHTPAHCAWCPFDFTPMNMLWIPPFCHFKRGSHGTDTHQFNGLVTQVGWQTSLGFIEEIYPNFGVFLGLAAFFYWHFFKSSWEEKASLMLKTRKGSSGVQLSRRFYKSNIKYYFHFLFQRNVHKITFRSKESLVKCTRLDPPKNTHDQTRSDTDWRTMSFMLSIFY